MLNRNARYYQWLLPYLEGGLDAAQRAQMEARLREDPTLAAEAARLRRTLDGLRTSARQPRADNARVPNDLWARLRARLEMEEAAKPAPAPARPTHAWWLTGVGATAAATLVLAMIWLPGWHAPEQINSHPTPKISSPTGPGRPAGPPPVSSVPPVPSSRVAAMPTKAVSHPAKVVTPGRTPAPAHVAALPSTLFSTTDGNRSDPFALQPTPATPTAAHSANMTASRLRPRDGLDEVAPSTPDAGGGTNALAPPPALQVKAFPAPMPPPAPVMARIQNGTQSLANSPAASAGQGQAEPQTNQAQSQGKVLTQTPVITLRAVNPKEHGTQQEKTTAKRVVPAGVMHDRFMAPAIGGGAFGGGGFGGNLSAGLDTWQATLAAAVQPPLWGDTAGEQQANQALLATKESGALDDLRARLEARRLQSPKDVVNGRMLAAVYEYGFSHESALHERRRVANLDGAVGEDWYALAQAEERAGNTEAARSAYRHALECPVPPSPYHAGLARLKS